jgi:hypothetical protein
MIARLCAADVERDPARAPRVRDPELVRLPVVLKAGQLAACKLRSAEVMAWLNATKSTK